MNILRKRYAILCGLVAASLLIIFLQRAHAETIDDLFNVWVLLPGVTENLDIVQTGMFPLCPQFFIVVVGEGSLGTSLKDDASTSKETMFMLGLASSGAGTFPIYRLGTSKGMISQIVEVGSDSYPGGVVWLYCGVLQADKNPVYLYELRLSFMP